MQRIERYGVVALVFFLVTIAAVSLWDDGVPEQAPGALKAEQRLAQKEKHEMPSFKGPQSRTLPVTARKNTSRPLKRAASRNRNRNAPGKRTAPNTGQSKFSALPSTVLAKAPTKKEDSEVVFPESLTVPDPRTQGRPERQTTNYDTVASREKALSQSTQNKRKRPDTKRQAKQETPAPSQSAGTYRVMKNDTLSGIASRTLGSSKRWREIQALNGNMDPSALKEGTLLLLPGGAAVAQGTPALNTRAARGARSSAGGYVVRKGDVLSRIAQNELGGASRWREIAALNPGIDPNRIKEGDYLRMPGSSTVLASLTSEPKPAKKKNRVR